jgi:uncharacterized CHY-type Zn-finger protein
VYPQNSQGLHCSHYFGRRNKSLRWDPDNAFAHCFGCHQKLGSNPHDFQRWAEDRLGSGTVEILNEKRNDLNLAKSLHKAEKEIAAHYKLEYETMLSRRAAGESGRLEFTGF